MNELVTVSEGQAMVSSKDISDKFNKVHRDVLRAIRLLDCSDEFRVRNFAQSSYMSLQNKELECMNMTRDGFAFLCMGFTGSDAAEWKERYISAFNSMESALSKTPVTMDQLNDLVARIEGNKEAASIAGKALSSYKKIKQQDANDFKSAVDQAQLALKI